ncbi:hypothetical protein ACHAPT_003701 [Fusarium lateritium]
MSSSDLEADCAQNIALLYYLGRIASRPHKNSIRRPEVDAGWTISLEDEKHLTSTLGLLSSIRDDINNVTAVCVEERQSGSREQLGSDVLRAIVSMCRWRILSRIRMIKLADKPSFEKSLTTINERMRKLPRSDSRVKFLELSGQLVSRLVEYRAAFTLRSSGTWALTPDEELESIIQTCYDISYMSNVGSMLKTDMERANEQVKPERRMNPNLWQGVLNMIRKVGNYKRAASTLVKLARRYECLRQASALEVTLEPSAFVQNSPARRPCLRAMLDRLKTHHGASWNSGQVAGRLSKYLGSESEHYQSKINKEMNDPRVHAEMQLIWYLDQHQCPNPPRVIASNKDACYLCNAFITFHGKYSIPRTHGRIYPGWRLPSSGLQDVKRAFSRELERLAVGKINSILKGGVERIDCPLESTVPSAAVSGISILTLQAEALQETVESSDSDETVVPENGINALDVQGQQTEEFVSLEEGNSTEQDGSDMKEEAPPSCDEVEGIASSIKELCLVSADEHVSDEKSCTPKTLSLEKLHDSGIGAETDSHSSVGSRLKQSTSLGASMAGSSDMKPCEESEQGGWRQVEKDRQDVVALSDSLELAALSDTKPCGDSEHDDQDGWRRAEKDRQEVVALSGSLELFVEYTTAPPSTSQRLRFKAWQLSDDEIAELKKDVQVHDLESLGEEAIHVEKSGGGILMRAGDQVFAVHLDEFVAASM